MESETVDQDPSPDEWRRLYAAMLRVKELEPWHRMLENEIFGIKDPETGEVGYVSVMGNLGEFRAVAVYQGLSGYYGFRAFQEAGDFAMETPELVFETPQLQASWADREELEKEDRDVIKALGLKFRGRSAWPLFRSYRPGQIPWFLESGEARFLALALEQLLDVYDRFLKDPDLLDPTEDIDDVLVRVPHLQDDGNLVWEDEVERVAPPEPMSIRISMDVDALDTLKNQLQVGASIEVDFFMFMSPVDDDVIGQRPYFPYMLLSVESKGGRILGLDMLKPLPSLEEMWGTIPAYVASHLTSLGRPKEIRVRSPLLKVVLQPLADAAGFSVKEARSLNKLDQARDAILDQFTASPKPLYP